jgi:hypothetical protein
VRATTWLLLSVALVTTVLRQARGGGGRRRRTLVSAAAVRSGKNFDVRLTSNTTSSLPLEGRNA